MSTWRKGDIAYLWPVTEKDWKKHDKMLEKSGGTKGCLHEWHTKVAKELYETHGIPMTKYIVSPRRPITYSTQATFQWLEILAEECSSWEEMYALTCGDGKYLRDDEAKNVVFALMNSGVEYNNYFTENSSTK